MTVDCARRVVFVLACLVFGGLPAFAGDCDPEWLPQVSGTNSDIRAMTVFDDGSGPALYAGGFFTQASGSSPASLRISRWDGSSWSPLGSGMTGAKFTNVSALAVFDDGSGPALYAGGEFTEAGGSTASNIARWNGSSWSPLGSGTNGAVLALMVFDDGSGPALYAGGEFTEAGGSPASRIARWDGASWSPLGSGLDSNFAPLVNALAVFDDGSGPGLYAGGNITQAGGNSANFIARWDGSSWSAVGSGTNGTVNSLTVFDDGNGPALYAGGSFGGAGGNSASRIARWDGSAWSPLGSGVSGGIFARVFSLTVFDDGSGSTALYAGGDFTQAGGNAANNIARWDGSSWSSLGSGVDNWVWAMEMFEDGSVPVLHAGGSFSQAGGNTANFFARWGRPCLPGPSIVSQPGSVLLPSVGGLANLTVAASGTGLTYQWFRDGQPLADSSMIIGSNSAQLTVSSQGPSKTGLYSCQITDAAGFSVMSNQAIIAARPSCPGDVNFDGVVDLNDLNIILTRFGTICP